MKSDRQLKQEVEEELDWDPAVTATDIGVEVADGVVTLSGHPPSYAEKLAAENAAQRVAGVKGVVVDMQVHLPFRDQHTDEDIASAVHAVLHWNAAVPENSIKVLVEKGGVTLTGAVDWAISAISSCARWGICAVCAASATISRCAGRSIPRTSARGSNRRCNGTSSAKRNTSA